MKKKRQERILQMIRETAISRQEDLAVRLNEEGFCVTQATVSRDIRELGLFKLSEDGETRYVQSERKRAGSGHSERFLRILREGFHSADFAGNMVVIHTAPGMAMAVGAVLDSLDYEAKLGSVCGDDTVICVIRTEEAAKEYATRVQELADGSAGIEDFKG